MCATGSLLAAACLAALGPTPLERAEPHFYGAWGGVVAANWALDPPEVPPGGESVLTLWVAGHRGPGSPRRPESARLPGFAAFAQAAQVLDAEPPVVRRESRVGFRYLLRPNGVGPAVVPALEYRYFRPGLPPGERFRTTYADPVTLTVRAPPAPPRPIDAPEWLWRAGYRPPLPAWLSAVPAGLGLVAFALKRPTPRRRRGGVSRRARERLARLSPGMATEAAGVVRAEVAGRTGLDARALTASELGEQLREAGYVADQAGAVAGFLEAADAARFGLTAAERDWPAGALAALERFHAAPPSPNGVAVRAGLLAGLAALLAGAAPGVDPALARAYELRDEPAAARAELRRVLAESGGDAFRRAQAHFLLGEFPEGLAACHAGRRASPGSPEFLTLLNWGRSQVEAPADLAPPLDWARWAVPLSALSLPLSAAALGLVAWRRRLAPVSLAVWVALAAGHWHLGEVARDFGEAPAAVVVRPALPLSGSGGAFAPRRPGAFPPGVELRRLRVRGGWAQVEWAERGKVVRAGWVPAATIAP